MLAPWLAVEELGLLDGRGRWEPVLGQNGHLENEAWLLSDV